MTVLRQLPGLYRLMGPHRGLFWLTLALALVAALWAVTTFLAASVLLQGLADASGVPGLARPAAGPFGRATEAIAHLPGPRRLMLGFAATVGTMVAGGVLRLLLHAVNMRFLTRVLVSLQTRCFDEALASRMDVHDDTRRSRLSQLLLVEVRACQSFMKELMLLADSALRLAVHGAVLLVISPGLTALTAGVGAAAWLAMRRLNQLNRRLSERALAWREDLSAVAHEALYGIRQVKLLGAGERVRAGFARASGGAARLAARVSVLVTGQAALMEAFGLIGVAGVVGLTVLVPDRLPAGTVLLFLFVVTGTIPVLASSARRYGIVDEQGAAVSQVLDYLGQAPAARERDGDLERPTLLRDRIDFERVTLDYGSRRGVLREVSLTIRRGERVGIVGPSGSGKTSLVGLLPRLYDPSAGTIRVDGTDLRRFRLEYLRRRIGLLSQDPFLFNATVRDNVRMGRPDAGDEAILAAARAAFADDFIRALPSGYDTIVGDRGAKLSGGQRQRLTIAQVFLRDPEILVLDEATSALDAESEAVVQRAIDALSRDRTVLIVAHRLSTLRDVDRVIVLDEGRVVEEGTWEALLRGGGVFARMWQAATTGPAPTAGPASGGREAP